MTKKIDTMNTEAESIARDLSAARGALKSLIKISTMVDCDVEVWRQNMLQHNSNIIESFIIRSDANVKFLRKYIRTLTF